MRICVTGLRGIPGVMGGVETHCEELLPRIAALAPDFEIEVLARKPYMPAGRTSYRGVIVTPLPSPRKQSIEAIVSTFIHIFYARWKGARLIHIHAIGPGLLAPLARLLGLKVVVTHHGADYDRAKWGRFAKFMLRAGERLSIFAAHRVIAVSPSLRERLAARFPSRASRIHYIPNGAPMLPDDGENRAAVLERIGVGEGKYILAVGRLVPEKGFDYLIEAVKRSGTTRKLVIAGGSDHDTPYARAVVAAADERIIFVGQQPRSVLRHLYDGADLFVLPSFHEGLPISALEAASCGTPMLLSDISANKDVGLPNKNYFPVGEVEILLRCLADPRRDFSINSEQAMASFDWDEIARLTEGIYRGGSLAASPAGI